MQSWLDATRSPKKTWMYFLTFPTFRFLIPLPNPNLGVMLMTLLPALKVFVTKLITAGHENYFFLALQLSHTQASLLLLQLLFNSPAENQCWGLDLKCIQSRGEARPFLFLCEHQPIRWGRKNSMLWWLSNENREAKSYSPTHTHTERLFSGCVHRCKRFSFEWPVLLQS